MSADLKAEVARYHDAFVRANEALSVREEAIERLTAERDRARAIAVALEQRVAKVERTQRYWAGLAGEVMDPESREWLTACSTSLRIALVGEQ